MAVPGSYLQQARSVMIRHRFTFQDAGLITVVVLIALLFAWQIDLFPNAPSQPIYEYIVELDEALAVAAMGFALFAWTRFRAQRREIARRRAAEGEARSLAFEDPLTGLPNRRQFDHALKAALAAPPRAGGAHAVLMIDLNGFKRINDVHGHAAGDEALIQVAIRLRQAVRGDDLVARLGGDEFAVLSRHLTGPEAATGLALRIIKQLEAPVTAGGVPHQMMGGIGLALSPQDGNDAAAVLRKADVALYRAKTETVSALRFFEPQMDESIRERDQLERDLRAAIGTPALRPFYQPLVDLKTGKIIGFEALARWNHPTLGEIQPNRFIPIADDTGLISKLTDTLLREACRDAVAWSEPVQLSFNISPVQLKDRTLAPRLLNILRETGLPPNRLEVEVTESALVSDLAAAQEILGAMRNAGVRIALDDFGTGYSSLYHLRNFSLDKIKIDRSFVNGMASDPNAAAIVRALIGLGTGLSLAVTAEGVEDSDQRSTLINAGCTQAQGFLFGKAIPADEVRLLFGRAHSPAGAPIPAPAK